MEIHYMDRIYSYEGVDTFFCSICGRRVYVYYTPRFRVVVITPGDTRAVHTGNEGFNIDLTEVG